MVLLGSKISFGIQYPRGPAGFELSEPESEQNTKTQPRILVVDDEKLLADTTADILRRAGFEAKTASDGFEALEMMATFRPDYLLTDIVMPGMNGAELAMATARMYPPTKILLFSGQAGVADILENSKSKGFEFPLLPKPVHPIKLIERLKALKNR